MVSLFADPKSTSNPVTQLCEEGICALKAKKIGKEQPEIFTSSLD